jgi:hypothetical protein
MSDEAAVTSWVSVVVVETCETNRLFDTSYQLILRQDLHVMAIVALLHPLEHFFWVCVRLRNRFG